MAKQRKTVKRKTLFGDVVEMTPRQSKEIDKKACKMIGLIARNAKRLGSNKKGKRKP